MNVVHANLPRAFSSVMLNVVGTELDENNIRRIRDPLMGGVILFARNYRDRAQLTELMAVRCVNLSMQKLGQLWGRDVLAATDVGYVLASEASQRRRSVVDAGA